MVKATAVLATLIAVVLFGNCAATADDGRHKHKRPNFDPNGSIFACVDRHGDIKRLVNDAARCWKRLTAVPWGGPGTPGLPGPQGDPGQDGAEGPPGPGVEEVS